MSNRAATPTRGSDTSDAATSVTLDEAVSLVAAFAARVAADANLRLLLIKGKPATDLGVRADRPSADVDVWIDPTRARDYVALLAGHGWENAPSPPAGVGWGHAATLTHPAWPTTIDVHRAFPGFLADDGIAFEQVWQRRRSATIADRPLATPDRVAAAAVTTLHALRSEVISETKGDLEMALGQAAVFSDRERRSLQGLAASTGSASTLAPLLHAAGIDDAGGVADNAKLEEWHQRTSIQGLPVAGWGLAIRRAPWSRRPGLILTALRPTDMDYANAGATRGAKAGSVRATAYRWRRAQLAVTDAMRRRLNRDR